MSERGPKNPWRDLTGAAATVGAATLAAAHPTIPVAAAAAAFPFLLDQLSTVVPRWRARNARHFMSGLSRPIPGRTPEEVLGLIETHIEEPFVSEVLFETARRMADTPHACVAEALGALAAEYIGSKREPDGFFRGLTRLLSDVDRREFDDARELLRRIVAAAHGEECVFVGSSRTATTKVLLVAGNRDRSKQEFEEDSLELENAERLLHLFRTHGLAAGGAGMSSQGEYVPGVEPTTWHYDWKIVVANAERMRALMG